MGFFDCGGIIHIRRHTACGNDIIDFDIFLIRIFYGVISWRLKTPINLGVAWPWCKGQGSFIQEVLGSIP